MEILRRPHALPGSTSPAPIRIHSVIDTLVDARFSVKTYCNVLEVSRQCYHPSRLSVGVVVFSHGRGARSPQFMNARNKCPRGFLDNVQGPYPLVLNGFLAFDVVAGRTWGCSTISLRCQQDPLTKVHRASPSAPTWGQEACTPCANIRGPHAR